MSSEIDMIEPTLPRAGYWRRAIAFFIDCAIVLIPVSLLAGLLFSVTDGRVYMSSPFLEYSYCSPQKSSPSILKPDPPAGSNFMTSCKIYTITGMTANLLIVGRTRVDGNFTSTVSTSYALDRDGQLAEGTTIDIGWVAEFFVLLLIIPMQLTIGRSFGQMALSTCIVYLKYPARTKIPLANLLLRYFFAFVFPLVFFIPALVWFFLPFTAATVVTVLFCVLPLVYWTIGNIGLIVQRKDPWFDRWSGLAVVKIYPDRRFSPPLLPATPPPLPHP